MKKYWISSIVLLSFLAGAVISCTNFRDDGIALGGVTTTVDKLSFSSSGSERSLVVTSGEVWSVTSIPSWLKIRTINSRGFSWDVTVAAEANNDYDRSGTLILRSSSSTASIAVSQDGKKGAYVPVTSVSLSPQTVEITEGDTRQLTATISPSNASVKDVSWKSSSTSIATVSSSGLVTAVSEGTATITVTTKDGSKTATSKVTVKKKVISVTGVSLDKTQMTLTEGETGQLTATVSPSNATNKNVSWKSSSTTVATVSSSGVVKAVSEGTATITVTTEDGSKSATCKVTVKKKAISVTGVSLDKTEIQIVEGETCQLTATVSPSNATNKNVNWKSSSTSIATVSSSGLVTAVSEGTATITVTTVDGSKTASCKVTVKKVISVTGVSLDMTKMTLTEGETGQLTATVSPSNATNRNVSWKSNSTSVAKVSSSGVVTAVSEGSATITVTTEDGNKTATCKVTVKKKTVSVTGVSLNYTGLTMQEGETWQLTATVSPSNASNKNVRWTSNSTEVAQVSQQGLVTAVSEGTATITVTTEDGGKTATCKVTVNRVPVTGVSLDRSEIQLTEGETWQLTATVSPSNATNKYVNWKSSSASIATVSSSGLVTAVSEGTATITVTVADGSKTASCKVTVNKKAISVTGVSLNYSGLTMKEGETWQLSATVSPSNATNKNVSWKSSSTSVATVSSSGLVTAVSEGTATITVTTEDGGYYAICNVTVNKKTVSVTGVSLNYTGLTMKEGETWQLTATVSPSNATNKNVSWKSSSTSVATVSSSGMVTAKQAGTTTITVTTVDGGYTANCTITVKSTSTTGYENGHEWVDLGLPSGLKWATCNVGANSPSDYGNYYAWGETSTKNIYDWSTYKWGSYNSLTKYNNRSDLGTVDNRTSLEMSDDAARANWGGRWRMPTEAEWTELIEKCNWTWTTQGGKIGYKVTSKTNGNSIFFPAAGNWSNNLDNAGSRGAYWSSSLYTGQLSAMAINMDPSGVSIVSWYTRTNGFSVRPVTK